MRHRSPQPEPKLCIRGRRSVLQAQHVLAIDGRADAQRRRIKLHLAARFGEVGSDGTPHRVVQRRIQTHGMSSARASGTQALKMTPAAAHLNTRIRISSDKAIQFNPCHCKQPDSGGVAGWTSDPHCVQSLEPLRRCGYPGLTTSVESVCQRSSIG